MSERPFMQLYVSDFVGDTLHLSVEQVGAYLLLLMAMWNAGGKLPNNDAKLARVARLSLKKWRSVAPDLMPFFAVEGDQITHGRLSKELQKSERQSQSRSAAGARGFAAKVLKNNNPMQANAKAGLKHSPEPYRKNARGAGVPTDGPVMLDRYADEDLFKACEAVAGKVPTFLQYKSFDLAVISQAKANLEALTNTDVNGVGHCASVTNRPLAAQDGGKVPFRFRSVVSTVLWLRVQPSDLSSLGRT